MALSEENERIIIKPEITGNMEFLIVEIMFILMYIWSVYVFWEQKKNGNFNTTKEVLGIIITSLFTFVVCAFITAYYISINRTFIMDKDGCIVCFRKYQKRYLWENFETKRLFYTTCARINVDSYGKAVFFSRKLHKPYSIASNPYSLTSILHPISFVWVEFQGRKESHKKAKNDNITLFHTVLKETPVVVPYPVKEGSFLERLESWNIKIERL